MTFDVIIVGAGIVGAACADEFAQAGLRVAVIEASQSRGEFPPNKMSIHLYVPDCDAIYQRGIEAGGKSIYEVSDMPYGERSGGIEDPCGNSWWIATQQTEMYSNK